MNKAELKAKWFKYINTDKLVDDMMALLTRYQHRNSERGVCTLLDTYFTNKEPLIKLFITSKNYTGDLRITTTQPFFRQPDRNEINKFFHKYDMNGNLLDSKQLLKQVDDKRKTMFDYLLTGKKKLDIGELPNAKNQMEKIISYSHFHRDYAATEDSVDQYVSFYAFMDALKSSPYVTLQRAISVNSKHKSPILASGTKTSRAFNKICQFYGIDKMNPQVVKTEENGQIVEKTIYPYNKIFAEYSDLVSDLERKLNFIISVNPLDYLTMSIGVNWNSCHSIKNHGSYQGGCLSYMLDGTSMVTFVIDNVDQPIHNIPRIYRQMIHYHNNLFIQNRLYPQGNDGATDLYTKFRNFVIAEFAELLHVDRDNWSVERGGIGKYTHSEGVHYRDYNYNGSCTAFYPSSQGKTATETVVNIGHSSICVNCGRELTSAVRLAHWDEAECR